MLGDFYVAQSLIDRLINESKHDAHDKLIQYSLWKGKGFALKNRHVRSQ